MLPQPGSELAASKQCLLARALQMSVEALKVKLSFHIGTNPSAQLLQLFDDNGNLVAPCLEDARKLGYYSPHDG